MSNKVNVQNNVTQHSVEVTTGGAVTNLVVSQNVTQHHVELNAGLFLPSPVTNLEDLGNVAAGATVGQVIEWDGTNWVPATISVSGSNLSFPTAVNGQILQYNGTNWVPVDANLQGGGQLTADIDVTDTVGNVNAGQTLSAGTDLEAIFEQMLVSYQAPVMSLSGWNSGTYEHGSTYSDSDFVLAFTNDANIDGTDTGDWSISDTYIGTASGTAVPSDGTTTTGTYSGTLLVSNTAVGSGAHQRTGAASLTVGGFTNSEGGAITPRTVSSTVRFRYWVVDSTTALVPDSMSTNDMANLMQGVDSSLNGTGSGVIESGLISGVSTMGFTAPGNHDYVYWIFPAALNVNSVVMNGSVNLYAGDKADKTTAVIHMGEVAVANQYGEVVQMEVLRSKVNNAFANGTVITIS